MSTIVPTNAPTADSSRARFTPNISQPLRQWTTRSCVISALFSAGARLNSAATHSQTRWPASLSLKLITQQNANFPPADQARPRFLLKTSKFQAAPFALLHSSAASYRPVTTDHNQGITSSFSASSVKYPKNPAPQIIATNRPAPIAIDRGRIFAFKYSRITV